MDLLLGTGTARAGRGMQLTPETASATEVGFASVELKLHVHLKQRSLWRLVSPQVVFVLEVNAKLIGS
jgi:hypothetical protein